MAKTFEAIISVLDKASQPILDLEEKLKKLAAQGKSTQHSLKMSPHEKLWNELTEHVHRADEGFKGLGENIGEMGARLGEVLPMLGVVGGVGSAAGLIELAHATAEAAEALHNVSLITGVAVPQLQALDFAGKQVGLSSDQMALGLEKLNVNIGKAAEGKNKDAAALFKAMGINLRDANGHVKSAAEILPQLEASFEKTKDPALRAAMAMALFGRSGVDLLPFLTQGPDAIAKLQAQFNKFGYSFSDEDQDGLEKFNDSWKDAQLAVEGFGDAIGAKLAPVLAPLLENFAELVADNRAWIATDLAGAVQALGDDLRKIDIHQVVTDFQDFVAGGADLIDRLGGVERALEIVGGVIAVQFLSPVLELTMQMGRLGIAMGAQLIGAVAGFGGALIELVPEIKSFSDVMATLDLAVEANPLGAIVVGAAAAGAVGYELYRNWDTVSKDLKKVWDTISSDFNYVFGPLEKTIDGIGQKITGLETALGFSGATEPSPEVGEPGVVRGRFGPIRLPSLNAPDSAANGKVDVHVKLSGAPAGTVVAAKSSGIASARVTNTGRNGTLDGPH